MQSKNVRGSRGVQMEEVWAAADAVLELGERPTIERVRQHLGRGSPNTVGPMLDGWFGSLAKRLQAPGDVVDGAQDPDNPLPAPVLKAAKTLWGRALQLAHVSATDRISHARAELEERAEALRQAQVELQREQQRLEDRSEAYAVAMRAKDAQITELSRQAHELQQQLVSSQEQLSSARSEGAQMRQTAEAQRRRNEAKDAEHQAERLRIEERAQAQERRLNAEVDRVRLESKRLAQQLESDRKKTAKELGDAIDKARDLDGHVETLQRERAALIEELESAREEVKGFQTKFDQRSNDMFAVLNELRDRLPMNSIRDPQSAPLRARQKRSQKDAKP